MYSFEFLDAAVVVDARAGAAVDPAIETHGDRREAVAGGVFDVDGKRRGVAAGAHRAEAGLVDGFEEPLLHRGDLRLGVQLTIRAQGRELGELGAMIERATDADADHHWRAML